MDRNDYYGGAAASLNLNQVSGALLSFLAELDGWLLIYVVFSLVMLDRPLGQ